MIADVPQTVTVQRVVDVTLTAQGRLWKRNLHGHSVTVRCSFAEKVGATRARGPITCSVRVYRGLKLHGLIGVRVFDLYVVKRHRAGLEEDGDGYATYSDGRSIDYNPRAPH